MGPPPFQPRRPSANSKLSGVCAGRCLTSPGYEATQTRYGSGVGRIRSSTFGGFAPPDFEGFDLGVTGGFWITLQLMSNL